MTGTVFPAGVGPVSLSRDAANWLSLRDSLCVLQNTQALRDVLAVKKRDLGRYGGVKGFDTLSLGNLILGNDCGRVLPAGIGL